MGLHVAEGNLPTVSCEHVWLRLEELPALGAPGEPLNKETCAITSSPSASQVACLVRECAVVTLVWASFRRRRGSRVAALGAVMSLGPAVCLGWNGSGVAAEVLTSQCSSLGCQCAPVCCKRGSFYHTPHGSYRADAAPLRPLAWHDRHCRPAIASTGVQRRNGHEACMEKTAPCEQILVCVKGWQLSLGGLGGLAWPPGGEAGEGLLQQSCTCCFFCGERACIFTWRGQLIGASKIKPPRLHTAYEC